MRSALREANGPADALQRRTGRDGDIVLRSIAAALACVTTMSACVFHHAYPRSWQARDEGCQNIAGVYSDVGERWASSVPFPFGGTTSTTRSLSGLLLNADEYGKPFVVHLTQRDTHTLDFTLSADHLLDSPHRLEYRCAPGGVEVKLAPRWVRQGLGVVRVWGRLDLSKDRDGNLIGHVIYYTYGIIFVIPVIGGGDLWYRFEHTEPPLGGERYGSLFMPWRFGSQLRQ